MICERCGTGCREEDMADPDRMICRSCASDEIASRVDAEKENILDEDGEMYFDQDSECAFGIEVLDNSYGESVIQNHNGLEIGRITTDLKGTHIFLPSTDESITCWELLGIISHLQELNGVW